MLLWLILLHLPEPLAFNWRLLKLPRRGSFDLARAHKSKFLAFAVECFGGWGNEAVQVIDLLKRKMAQIPPTVPSPSGEDVVRALAVSLQRGNCHVMNAGALVTRASQLIQQA